MAILVPKFVYPMRVLGTGSQTCSAGSDVSDVEAVSFNTSGGARAVTVATNADARFNGSFGRATFPDAAGDTSDRAAGMKWGMGLATWKRDQLLAGKTFWAALSLVCDYATPFAGGGITPLLPFLQGFHTQTNNKFGQDRVRSSGAGYSLQTVMQENNGADTMNQSSKDHLATIADSGDPGTYGPNIGVHSGNLVQVLIQTTMVDPNRIAAGVTYPHNMSAWFYTQAPNGSTFFAPTVFTHYAPTDVATNALNTRVEEPLHCGRTIATSGTSGYRGDLLGAVFGVLDSGALLSDAEQIAGAVAVMWDDAVRVNGGGAARNRSRSRARAGSF